MDADRCECKLSIGSVVMFCLISVSPIEVKATVHDAHKWMSHCHVAVTEHRFDNPNAECFCVKMDKENE